MLGGLNQMKKVLRILVLGMMATLAFPAVFAQERTREVVYNEYMQNYESPTIEGKQKAIDAAKEYIAKFNTETDADQVNYFKTAIPTLEEAIVKQKEGDKVAAEKKDWNARLVKFDTAFKAKNWDGAMAAGNEALAFQPQSLDKQTVDKTKFDLRIVMTAVGYDLAEAKNNKYNAETIENAKKIIQAIESGMTSENYGNYGTHQFKTKEFPDGKNNALGWMNYTIGYITAYGQKNQPGALPYLYKATQTQSATQKFPVIYELIGDHYYNEVAKLDAQRVEIQKANEGKDNDESNAKYALEKGYAERGADAYARAYKIVKDDAKIPKEYKDLLFSRLQQLYKFRNNDKTDGLDTYVASVTNKPFPNPTSTVEPIKDDPETTTTTSSTSTTTATPSTATKTVDAKTAVTTTNTANKTPANKKPRKR